MTVRHIGWLPLLSLPLLLAAFAAGPDRLASDPSGLAELHSSGGVLTATLVAQAGKIHVGGLELDGMTYNGQYAGPVLRVRPGDRLRIRLVNKLAEPTNLHFHGIRGAPVGNGDNAHIAVPPGGSFAYDLQVPLTQPPGLYWYHAHLHGISENQVMRGLSGALVIEGEAEASGMAEQLFVLKDMAFDDDTGNPAIDDDLHGLVQSINGELLTERSMRPGEAQIWRFSNQSANRVFHVAVSGHRFRIVAEDGAASADGRTADVLDILPAARVEAVVVGGAPGSYDIISKGAMTGTGAARTRDRVLGHLTVASEPAETASVPTPAQLPRDLRDAAIDARRTVVFTQTSTLQASAQQFFVDGKTFDPGRVDTRVPLGHIEEWTVRNESDDFHAFHIHQLGFQVVAINGRPVPFTGERDTVRVPERGDVTIRLAFTDPLIVGRFMYHCHVLKHEDKGMMAQIEVYDPAPPRLRDRLRRFYWHVWWWAHGVPWTQCGLANA